MIFLDTSFLTPVSERRVLFGFFVAAVIAVAVAGVSFLSIERLRDDGLWIAHTQEVIATLEDVLATATDAETAGRGYTITGDAAYLQPYEAATQRVATVMDGLRHLLADNPGQLQRLEKLSGLVEQRMGVVHFLADLRRREGFEAARAMVAAGKGKQLHDALRRAVEEMEETERALLKDRLANSERSTWYSLAAGALGTLIAVGMAGASTYLVRRDFAGSRKAHAELERSNRELDDFAYIASHDLKEPLRGLHNYASFLQEDYADRLDDEGQRYLERMQRLVERLTALIDGLLAYSRLGSTELALESVALDPLLDDVIEDLKIFLADHGAALVRAAPLPVVRCNALRVREIFQNLIVNAAKYNDKPGKRVEVGCSGTAPPVFYVRDNGIGIAPQHQDSVFRIFKRLHEQDKYGGGTGAGLTIVKKIVERHGGRIWLESTPGEGTTFYFTLSGETP